MNIYITNICSRLHHKLLRMTWEHPCHDNNAKILT